MDMSVIRSPPGTRGTISRGTIGRGGHRGLHSVRLAHVALFYARAPC